MTATDTDEEFGSPKGLIPLMTNRHKVCLEMDNRELNTYVDTFTGAADVYLKKKPARMETAGCERIHSGPQESVSVGSL